LAFRLRSGTTFGNFVAGPNAAAVRSIEIAATGAGEHYLYIWGGPGTGKTHLLEAACQARHGRGQPSVLLALRGLARPGAEILEGLEQIALVCIDDVDAIAGRCSWEEGLFHLHNRVRGAASRLVMTGARAPTALGLGLPDLVSRLSAALVYRLVELDDAQRTEALRRRARERGFDIGPEAAEYLLRRQPRDMRYLMGLIERLDLASLAAKRRVTIPFLRELLRASGA
jgi:DnaA family protein